MSVSLSLFAGAGQQFFTNNGVPLAGGLLYTYVAGTTTPQATYTSNSGATAQPNPIVLDSAGRVPAEIWLTDGVTYKFVLMDSASVLIGTYDNISSQNSFVGDIVIDGTLNVTGIVTLASNLNVTGNTALTGTLAVTGSTTLASTLDVTGNATFDGDVTVNGQLLGVAGRIVQAVTVNFDTLFSTTSGTYVSTGHVASITPTSTSSKILVLLTSTLANDSTNRNTILSIVRNGSSSLSGGGSTAFCAALSSAGNIYTNAAVNYLDSPATISATTYTVTVAAQSGSTAQYNYAASISSASRAVLTLLEITQ